MTALVGSLVDWATAFAFAAALAALLYGTLSMAWIQRQSPGDEGIMAIAAAIREGAEAYLHRQYRTIALVGGLLFVALAATLGPAVAFGFAVGAGLSAVSGYLGMKNQLQPRPAVAGNAYRNAHQLPRGLLEALLEFEDSKDLHDILGHRFSHVYMQMKRSEFEEFMRVISPWEREHLLLSV